MTALVVGGGSGLGLEIAKRLSAAGLDVYSTGRSAALVPDNVSFLPFEITDDAAKLCNDADELIAALPPVGLFVYAAGFYEQGHIDELSDAHMLTTIHVGLTAPALLLRRLLKKQGELGGLIAVTSTSQWIPRGREPLYAATKAGVAMLAQSLSLDRRIQKTLVVGPAGMNTPFWRKSDRDTTSLLAPHAVAARVMELWEETYAFRLARILRDPERVEIIETR